MNGNVSSNMNHMAPKAVEHLIKRLKAQSENGDPAVRDFALSLLTELNEQTATPASSLLYRYMTDSDATLWSETTASELASSQVTLKGDICDSDYVRLVVVQSTGEYASEVLSEMAEAFFNILTVFNETYELNGQILFLVRNADDFSSALHGYHAAIEGDLMAKSLVLASACGQGLLSVRRLYKTIQTMLYLTTSKNDSQESMVFSFETELPPLLLQDLTQDMKANLHQTFYRCFASGHDDELIRTAEQFFKSNLNVSDTAKALFIHRNTLVYRLEKIQRDTGFDLRHFEDSWIFRLLLTQL